MQSKRKLSVEWISNDNQQGFYVSNCNVEPLCVVQEKSQRQIHSHANLYDRKHQYTPTRVPVPTTADNGTSITSARVYARRAFPAMSTCSLAQQYGMSLSSPTTAHPAEIEWDVTVTNAKCSVSLLQNVGLNTLYISDRNSESMLQSYVHSYAQRPKKYIMATRMAQARRRHSPHLDAKTQHELLDIGQYPWYFSSVPASFAGLLRLSLLGRRPLYQTAYTWTSHQWTVIITSRFRLTVNWILISVWHTFYIRY